MKTLQLLSHPKRDKEGRVYTYYSIAEPYWDKKAKRNRKRILLYLSSLTDEKAEQIKRFLRLINGNKDMVVTTVEDIIFDKHWHYLDVAFLSHLWDQWGLSGIFPQSKGKGVQISEIARILTIYRCLDPGSYLSAVGWFKKTALDIILHIDNRQINKSRIFRELDGIEDRKPDIEDYLYKILKERDESSMKIVFYDLTDSYFEGGKCELATPGRTKSNGFRKKRIVLSLLINSEGYPFAWNVIEDYTADVKTIKGLSLNWKTKFEFGDNEIVLVFDRGMVSDENLKHLEKEKYCYITALDKNQVPNIKGVNIERFESLNGRNMAREITKMGFEKYDDKTYYEDVGVIDDRRYTLVFNPEMFRGERKSREELIERAKECLKEENNALSEAENSRDESTTRNKIDKKLKGLKARKLMDYDLEPLPIISDGKKINSFRIIPKETKKTVEAIKNAGRTDGLWMIVTNIPGEDDKKASTKKTFTPPELISTYRDKNQIEHAFKDVKSFIKLQPFNVWKPKHVRAHYTICVLSYLMDITIANHLREKDIGVKSPQKVYEVLRRGIVGRMRGYDGGREILKLMRPQAKEIQLLNLFECEHITGKKHLESMKIHP